MAIEKSLIQAEPVISAIINGDNTGVLKIGREEHPYEDKDLHALRQLLMKRVMGEAATLGRPVRVTVMDNSGVTYLAVSPDGEVEEETAQEQPQTPAEPAVENVLTWPTRVAAQNITPSEIANSKGAVSGFPKLWPPTVVESVLKPEPTTETETSTPGSPRRSLRDTSFLVSAPVQEPATQGWRGSLTRLGFRMDPSEDELAEREDVRTVSAHWPGPRTIAVVNRKGGANKTPTVVMLSAILARYSGAATVAWDNNESQGTLGWRTEKGSHDRSVLDLIDSSSSLLSPSTSAAEIAKFVHHQTGDKFDVLRSDENEEGDHEITAEEVDIAHQVLTRYYRLVVMDSGNTARSANWRRMIHYTNQLVVPVTAIEDRAEAARLTLQTLESRGGHDAELARNAVVIVSESTDAKRSMSGEALKRAKDEARRIADGFEPFVRAVVRVPYDSALVNGPIRYEALQPATQRAWLAAAAAVARGL